MDNKSGENVAASLILLSHPLQVQSAIIRLGRGGFVGRHNADVLKSTAHLLSDAEARNDNYQFTNNNNSTEKDVSDALIRIVQNADGGNPLALEMIKFYLQEAHRNNEIFMRNRENNIPRENPPENNMRDNEYNMRT